MRCSIDPFPITPETAIELIDQVIDHYVDLCEQGKKNGQDLDSIAQWEIEVFNLRQEQKACRILVTKALMIEKVHKVYLPFLKNLREKDK